MIETSGWPLDMRLVKYRRKDPPGEDSIDIILGP